MLLYLAWPYGSWFSLHWNCGPSYPWAGLAAHVATWPGLVAHVITWPGMAAHVATWLGLVAHVIPGPDWRLMLLPGLGLWLMVFACPGLVCPRHLPCLEDRISTWLGLAGRVTI
jgi:hypothetical protein